MQAHCVTCYGRFETTNNADYCWDCRWAKLQEAVEMLQDELFRMAANLHRDKELYIKVAKRILKQLDELKSAR